VAAIGMSLTCPSDLGGRISSDTARIRPSTGQGKALRARSAAESVHAMAVEGHTAGPGPAVEPAAPAPAAPTAAAALAPAAAGRVALAAPGGAIRPAAVRALQRTAGNQAVSRLAADRAVLARNGRTAPAATPDFATTLTTSAPRSMR
jgi:hypothetical protein